MRNIALTIEYRGTAFHGWQRQPRLRTVQGELEEALATVLREPVALHGAGRTDAGVHALGQVANFRTARDLPLARLVRGVNALTGNDVAVREAREVADSFDARRSARARHYVYLLLARPSPFWDERAWQPRRWPDPAPMNAAVAQLVGEHDFAAFSCASADETDSRTRVFYAFWEPWDRGLALRVGAVRFLYRMVRCIAGASLAAGTGVLSPETLGSWRDDPPHRGRLVAPARGLALAAVDYGEAAAWPGGRFDCPPPGPVL